MASSSGTKGAGTKGIGDRESREAAALRANLARRKDQKRAQRGSGGGSGSDSGRNSARISERAPAAAVGGQKPAAEDGIGEGEGRS